MKISSKYKEREHDRQDWKIQFTRSSWGSYQVWLWRRRSDHVSTRAELALHTSESFEESTAVFEFVRKLPDSVLLAMWDSANNLWDLHIDAITDGQVV